MATVSFQRTDGSTVSFMAKKSSGPKSSRKRNTKGQFTKGAAKRAASKASSTTRAAAKPKSCGCAGVSKTREHADLALQRVENLKDFTVSNVQTLRKELGEVKGRVARAEGRIDQHDQALASLAARARGMFTAPGTPAAVPTSSRGAGGIEQGRAPSPRPVQAPPRIAPGAAVPNRQMSLGLN